MMIRSFLALELPPSLQKAVVRLQTQLQAVLTPVKWVKESSLHLTLKFLGDIDSFAIETIREGVGSVVQEYQGFSLGIQGLGVFPNLQRPRTLWLGVIGERAVLDSLVSALDQELERQGFLRETKPFHPHLTLARIKPPSREIGKILATSGFLGDSATIGEFSVTHVSLFKSELRPEGSVYTRLWEVPIGKSLT